MEISTPRLKLREYGVKDLKDIVEAMDNLNVTRFLSVVPHPYALKDAQEWVERCQAEPKENPRKKYSLGMELKSESKLIGGIGLTDIDPFPGTAELGYCLGESHWRKGYVSEAATALLDFAFNELNLNRIEAFTLGENEPSQKLLEKLGFKYEGTSPQAVRAKSTGKIHDKIIYGLLKQDWKR